MEFLALPIFIFFTYAVYSFFEKSHLAVIWILLINIANAWFIEPPSVKIGLNIYLNDIVFFPLFLSAFLRIFLKREWRYSSPLWICYGIIIFSGATVGLKIYGTMAGVDFRNFFYYWTGAFYFMTFPYTKETLDKVVKYWLLICLALLLIVYFRFVAEFLHMPIAKTWMAADTTEGVKFRVINAGRAYLLGMLVIMLFHRYVLPDFKKPSRVLMATIIVAVIALQHRSVWAATIIGIMSLFILPGVKKHKIVGNFIVIGLVGVVLLIPILLSGYADNFIDSISGSAERATNLQAGTFGSRVKNWERIMRYWVTLGFGDQLLGEPFGSGYAGIITAPHNMFFHSLLRAGMLGTFILILFYVVTLIRLYFNLMKDPDNRVYPLLFFMLVVAQMAYYIPYSPQAEHGIILGIAASLAKRKVSSSKTQGNENNTSYYLKPFSKA